MDGELDAAYLNFVKEGGNIKFVPANYLSKEMCDSYVADGGNLDTVFEEQKAKELYAHYIISGGSINSVPRKYCTTEFVDLLFNEEFEVVKASKDTLNFIKYIRVKAEILFSVESGNTKDDIARCYSVSLDFVNDVLDEIKREDLDIYNQLCDTLENNQKTFVENTRLYVAELNDVIESLGEISNKKLSQEQKMKFAYLSKRLEHSVDFPTLYEFIKANKIPGANRVNNFLKNIGFYYQKIIKDFRNAVYDEDAYMNRYEMEWLAHYDIDIDYKDTITVRNTKRKYVTNNGDIVEVDKNQALQVIGILEENEIPIVNCIVKSALMKFANGELNEFIEDLRLFDGEQFTHNNGNQKVLER